MANVNIIIINFKTTTIQQYKHIDFDSERRTEATNHSKKAKQKKKKSTESGSPVHDYTEYMTEWDRIY